MSASACFRHEAPTEKTIKQFLTKVFDVEANRVNVDFSYNVPILEGTGRTLREGTRHTVLVTVQGDVMNGDKNLNPVELQHRLVDGLRLSHIWGKNTPIIKVNLPSRTEILSEKTPENTADIYERVMPS